MTGDRAGLGDEDEGEIERDGDESWLQRIWKTFRRQWCPHNNDYVELQCMLNPIETGGYGEYKWVCQKCGWERQAFSGNYPRKR